MNTSTVTLRRIVGLSAAVLVGAVVALVVATPASAHYSAVTADSVCNTDTGQWQVTWTVTSHATPLNGNLTKVVLTPGGTTVTNITIGAALPPAPGHLVGVQLVPGSATSASLTVRAHWTDGWTDSQDRSATVNFSGTCLQDQPKPNASFESACDGSVTVTLTNDADATKSAAFAVTGTGGFLQNVTVAKGGTASVLVGPSSAGTIVVKVGTTQVAQSSWQQPLNCPPVQISSKADCTSLTITLENPPGNRPVDALITNSGNSQTITVGAGESKDVTLPASSGTTVTVSFGAAALQAARIKAAANSLQPITIVWEKPAACVPTPTPSPSPLPKTGSRTGPMVAAGGALLVLGSGLLYLLFRRRRAMESPTF